MNTKFAVDQAIDCIADEAFDQIIDQAYNPQEIYEHVRASSSLTTHLIQGTRNVERSTLWLMPVVTRGGTGDVMLNRPTDTDSTDVLYGGWFRDWFSMHTRVSLYNYLPGYISISTMTPRELRNALKGLVRRHDSVRTNFLPPSKEALEQMQVGIPDLTYFVGAVSSIGGNPIIPNTGRSKDWQLIQRMRGAMSLCSNEPTFKGRRLRIAPPASFSEALYTGLRMWVHEVANDFETLAWDAIPRGCGKVTLRWDLLNRKTEMETRICRSLQTMQLGEKHIQEIFHHVSETLDNPQEKRRSTKLRASCSSLC